LIYPLGRVGLGVVDGIIANSDAITLREISEWGSRVLLSIVREEYLRNAEKKKYFVFKKTSNGSRGSLAKGNKSTEIMDYQYKRMFLFRARKRTD
jgi:hypothetical protein